MILGLLTLIIVIVITIVVTTTYVFIIIVIRIIIVENTLTTIIITAFNIITIIDIRLFEPRFSSSFFVFTLVPASKMLVVVISLELLSLLLLMLLLPDISLFLSLSTCHIISYVIIIVP